VREGVDGLLELHRPAPFLGRGLEGGQHLGVAPLLVLEEAVE
jgi:hypothetical protein